MDRNKLDRPLPRLNSINVMQNDDQVQPLPFPGMQVASDLKSVIQSGNVDEDESDHGLEDQGEVQDPVAHAALEDWQPARPR